MIYISKLDLNRRSPGVRADLADPYQLHRTLCKAFGEGEGELGAARLLFRVDESQDQLWVLAQSRVAPDWDRLTVASSYLVAPVAVKEWDPRFPPGQRLRFRLRANPTVKREGKRRALATHEDQLQWLERKAGSGGFRLLGVEPNPEKWLASRTSRGDQAALVAVRFDGVLRVTDPDLFAAAVENGIGSAKGFGFGLLSVARA